jgi:peptidoglycan/xylan/chitin deacetylase (PgdA/CDA1 family)
VTRAVAARWLALCSLALLVPGCATGGLGFWGWLGGGYASDDFIVAVARSDDTAETLAARYLRDRGKAWMIEDYNGSATFKPGTAVVIPRHAWNPSGVEPSGYQLVPVLVYHDIRPQARRPLTVAARAFAEQMRYLKANGYRVVGLRGLYEFMSLQGQLPRKSVVLTFDDGYRSFRQYAYPVLRELGFTATLFVYTDYIDSGRNALGWADLKRLAAEGFEIEAHSKTHSDLRHRADESEAEYLRRIRAETEIPQRLFEQHLGLKPQFLAYPYGAADAQVIQAARERGFLAGFTVLRGGNSAFAPLYRVSRSQIYPEMTLEEFTRNLTTFAAETIR